LIMPGSSSLYASGGRRMYLSSDTSPPRSCRRSGWARTAQRQAGSGQAGGRAG
jgi:hypothetical protein